MASQRLDDFEKGHAHKSTKQRSCEWGCHTLRWILHIIECFDPAYLYLEFMFGTASWRRERCQVRGSFGSPTTPTRPELG